MYPISRAAELTGVPVATLRAWERRYAIVAPQRTDGGYRLYDEGALARIAAMRDLVARGWLPKQAAEHIRDAGVPGTPAPATEAPPSTAQPPTAQPPTAQPRTAQPRTAQPRTAQPRDVETSRRGREVGGLELGVKSRTRGQGGGDHDLIAAARELDVVRLGAILDERFARGSFEAVVDDWLMPALHDVGDAWAEGTISPASEHLVAHAVLRRLSAAFEAAAHGVTGPTVLIGLAPGSRHELGALAFATAARRAGLTVTYLGADLPIESWLGAVAAAQPAAVVVPVPRRRDVAAALAVVEAVRAADPDVRIVLGGGQQDRVPANASRLGHRIGPAAAALATELAGR